MTMMILAAIMLSASMQSPAPAAGPVPQMRRGPIEAPRSTGSCAAAPLDLAAVIPVVEVTIGGRGPYRFAVDTGAQGHGRIRRELAEELGLAVVGQARTPAPGGTFEERPVFGLPALAVGGIIFHDAQLLAAPAIAGRPLPWDGILGVDLFRNFTLTLDYGNRRLHVGERPLATGVALAADQPVPTFPIEIAGRSFAVHLDTGNQAAPLFLTEADALSLPLAGAPVERGRARTSFGEVAIMEAPLAVPVRVGAFALPVDRVGWPAARGMGNLGSRGLAGTVVRLDQRSRRLDIAASGAAETCPGA
jgi:hypothetical protein